MNQVSLIGRLTADPRSRSVGEGTKTTFSIAYEHPARRKSDADGAEADRPKGHVSFFDVEAWDRLGERVASAGAKGRLVAVTGELRQERWTEGGKNRSRVVLRARNVRMLGRPKGEEKEADSSDKPSAGNAEPAA